LLHFLPNKKAKQSEGDGKRKEKGKEEERGHMQTTEAFPKCYFSASSRYEHVESDKKK